MSATILTILDLALIAGALIVATNAIVQWRASRSTTLLWVAGALGTFALSRLAFVVLPWEVTGANDDWYWRFVFVVVLMTPWCLFRLMCEHATASRVLRVSGDVLGLIAVFMYLIPASLFSPTSSRATSVSMTATLVGLGFLVFAVGAGLVLGVRATRRQPVISRRRSALLTISVALFGIALPITGIRTYPEVLAVLAFAAFTVAVLDAATVPPRFLRDAWQAPQLRRTLQVLESLLTCEHTDEVVTKFMPAMLETTGARGAQIVDRSTQRVVGAAGDCDDVAPHIVDARVAELHLHHVPGRPVVGPEHDALMDAIGALVGLALERCAARERERGDTDRRIAAAEALEAANAELVRVSAIKDTFVAMASHELRTPVTTISGFSSTLVRMWSELEDDERKRFVTIVDDQAARLVALVEDLLLVSQIERGAISVDLTDVDIARMIVDVCSEMSLHDESLSVELQVTPGIRALADQRHLQQILQNLVSNADKYGAAPIVVRAAESSDGRRIRIDVTDAGEGVDETFVNHLFESFTRYEPTSEVPGTGLGLFIVRRLAHAQGGNVWFEPHKPTGARFVVEVPSIDG